MAENIKNFTNTDKNFYYIDTHAHLDMIKNKTPENTVSGAVGQNVRYIINVGSSLEGSRRSLDFSKKFENVFASVGIHPHYVRGFGKKEIQKLKSLISSYDEDDNIMGKVYGNKGNIKEYKKVIAVGETGFDFYRNLSPKEDQKIAFISQIELAIEYDIPVIIHDRDAHKDTLEVIKEYKGEKKFRAVMHCFSGDTNLAAKCLDLGLFISFTGVITFPNAKKTVDVVKEIPIEKIFIETDAPFLAPQPKRGKENYPEYVIYVAEKIAEIKKMSLQEVAVITSKNAEKFFSI